MPRRSFNLPLTVIARSRRRRSNLGQEEPPSARDCFAALAMTAGPGLALHQFDTDAVGGRDVAEQATADALLQLDREVDALGAQFGAEGGEVAAVHKAEMVGAERVVGREISEWLD